MSNFNQWHSGTALLIVLGITASQAAPAMMSVPAIAQNINFPDVQSNYWARGYIEALAAKEIIKGFPNGDFKPDEPVTRAEFAAMILKAFEKPQIRNDSTFVDVPINHWAFSAIRKANTTGFLAGYPGSVFRPNQNIPRVQVLVSLSNGLTYAASGETTATLQTYRDASSIPDYARNSTAAATEKKIVVNYPDVNLLNPNRRATRAEVAAFIYQALVSTGQAQVISSPFVASSAVDTVPNQIQPSSNQSSTSNPTQKPPQPNQPSPPPIIILNQPTQNNSNQAQNQNSNQAQNNSQQNANQQNQQNPTQNNSNQAQNNSQQNANQQSQQNQSNPSAQNPAPPQGTLADGTVINESPTNESPPRSLVEQTPKRRPISHLEVYVLDPKFDNKVKNTVDASSSSERVASNQNQEIPASASYQKWIDLAKQASQSAIAFQPVASITESGSQDLSSPASVSSATGTIEKISSENPPTIGQSKPSALIDSVDIDHNLSFNQKTKGIAVTITSYIWSAKGETGSINVYVKRPDGSYVSSQNPGYKTHKQVLTSGVKVKFPSDNTKVNTVVYLPYPAFDLPSGKTSDLKLQVQIKKDNSSEALANDESKSFDITTQTKVQQPLQSLLASVPKGKPVVFLINGYYGQAHPEFLRQVFESDPSQVFPDYKLTDGNQVRGLGIPTLVGNWDDLYSEYVGTTIRSDNKFRQQMYTALRQLDPENPIILIGHSFGGDSLMQVARCEAGVLNDCPTNIIPGTSKDKVGSSQTPERKFLFLGTLDPVMAGGRRMRRVVPPNIRYFFNRWTENSVLLKNLNIPSITIPGLPAGAGIPVDHEISGELAIDGTFLAPNGKKSFSNDQTEQSNSKNWDGAEVKVECGWLQVSCDGYVAPTLTRKGRKGTKPMMLDHGEIPNDMYVQRQILEAITKLLATSPTPNSSTTKRGEVSPTSNKPPVGKDDN